MVIHVAPMFQKHSHLQIDENWFRAESPGIPGATVKPGKRQGQMTNIRKD